MIGVYLAIAAWHAVQGRLPQAGFEALVGAGFAVLLTAPQPMRGPRAWIGTGLFLTGALGPIVLNL